VFSVYFQGFEAHRWVDLVEIYPLDPSKSFAFNFWESTFAYTRTSNLATLDNLGYNSEGRIKGYRQDNGERRRKYRHHNPRTYPRGGFPPQGLYIFVLRGIVFPSTNGEGSLIFKGAYRSRHSRLQNPEIKISRGLLRFEAYRWVDLIEIYPLDPSNSFAFDIRKSAFA